MARFQHAGLAHGRLDPTNVYVQDDGSITFVGWRSASAAAPRTRLGADVATLLFTTSLVVGDDRAIAAALGWTRQGRARGERPVRAVAGRAP